MGALHGDDESRNMRLNLQCHPSTPSSALDEITVEWSMSKTGTIWLRYHVAGNVEAIRLATNLEHPQRTDNLWQSTCFELFLKETTSERYCEFNFSPSGNWAAYRFDGYRDAMAPLALPKAPEICLDFSDSHIGLETRFGLPDIWSAQKLVAGLSAVIEMRDGEKSFWALVHPPGSPDFHHRDSFTLTIEATES